MKKEITYAFIDAQNLNLGTSKDVNRNGKIIYKGWKLDFKKFFIYLKNKFQVEKAILFIGYIKENQKLYDSLSSFGYELVYKPSVKNHDGVVKGNVDAEIVLYSSSIYYNNYNKAVIVSGDGDFYCLHKFLVERKKLKTIIIPNKYSESSLLSQFQNYKIFINREKEKLEFRQKK
ncbi:MAG: NYN domain-containing protein [Candidatus Shapirobacteria bacterium]